MCDGSHTHVAVQVLLFISVPGLGHCRDLEDASKGKVAGKGLARCPAAFVSSRALAFLSWQAGTGWTVPSAVPVARGALAVT